MSVHSGSRRETLETIRFAPTMREQSRSHLDSWSVRSFQLLQSSFELIATHFLTATDLAMGNSEARRKRICPLGPHNLHTVLFDRRRQSLDHHTPGPKRLENLFLRQRRLNRIWVKN